MNIAWQYALRPNGVASNDVAQEVDLCAAFGLGTLALDLGWPDDEAWESLWLRLDRLADTLQAHDLAIGALAIRGNTIATPLPEAEARYRRAIDWVHGHDCRIVSGISGYCESLSLEENLSRYQERFEPIARYAAEHQVRVAFSPWPGRQEKDGSLRRANLAVTPSLYDRLFDLVPEPALGIEYDPAQYAWQGIDPLEIVGRYSERIHHCLLSDVVIDEALLRQVGIHAPDWHRPVPIGLGQLNWREIIEALDGIGYRGYLTIASLGASQGNHTPEERLSIALKTLLPLSEGLR